VTGFVTARSSRTRDHDPVVLHDGSMVARVTYRSEQGALDAELERLEADLAVVSPKVQELERRLAQHGRARRESKVRLALAIGLALSAGGAVDRWDRKHRLDDEYGGLESDIAWLEVHVEELRHTPSKVEYEPPPRDALFEAIRHSDPRKPTDAWWIVAHATCRQSRSKEEKSQVLAQLEPEERERARAFCEKEAAAR
jgi:hypothetical protein